MRIEGYERRGKKDAEAGRGTEAAEASDAAPANEHTTEREEAAASASESVRSEPVEVLPPPLDPERASLLEQALRQAWSLARCDQRLTKRLGLL